MVYRDLALHTYSPITTSNIKKIPRMETVDNRELSYVHLPIKRIGTI